jgi:hypothetical protein
MSIVTLSSSVISPPKKGDITTLLGLKVTMHLFEPEHFIFPFLAYALGEWSGLL